MVDIKKIEKRAKGIKAKDFMSRSAITIKEDATVTNLAELMKQHKISGVPVIDTKGEISGIVTGTDLFNLMTRVVIDIDRGTKPIDYQVMKISDIMTKSVMTITEDSTLYDMMKLMCISNIHTLPVTAQSKKEIIGVIGRQDVIDMFYVKMDDH